jgi:AcrR family transcriptional regulator
MPKFSEHERAEIADRLLGAARARFATQGLRKTSVDELAADARISKGSFYAFHASKEELFLAVYARWAHEMRAQAVSDAFPQGVADRDAIRVFTRTAVRGFEDGTSISRVFSEQDIELAFRKVPPEKAMAFFDLGEHWLAGAARAWQERGLASNLDADVVAEAIGLVSLIPLNPGVRREGPYREAMDLIVDAVADRLTR